MKLCVRACVCVLCVCVECVCVCVCVCVRVCVCVCERERERERDRERERERRKTLLTTSKLLILSLGYFTNTEAANPRSWYSAKFFCKKKYM